VLNTPKIKIYVVEVSSFQLEAIKKFRPKIAAFLNLTPDHLDRHFTMENYLLEKTKLFKNMKKNGYILLNYDDERVKNLKNQVKAKVYFFSTKERVKKGVFIADKKIIFANEKKEEVLLELPDINLLGEHNLSNILCASLACYLYKIKPNFIKQGIKTFVPVAHRLAFIAEIKGVSYYNDSKATNIDACKKALSSFKQKIVLMLGGSDKGENFDELFKTLTKNVKAVVVSGDNKNKILTSAKKCNFKKIHEAKNFEDCFKIASSIAKAKEVVLLAPASASFDEFVNYADRGETFTKLVGELYD
jgi:UDP-N-acetylmuramoylalanine--D-glutamate ligase